MSVVTNLILTMSVMEEVDREDNIPAMDQVNFCLPVPMARVDHLSGGNKGTEAIVFMGAYNHLDLQDFVALLNDIPWEDPDNVRLFVQCEDDDYFWESDTLHPRSNHE